MRANVRSSFSTSAASGSGRMREGNRNKRSVKLAGSAIASRLPDTGWRHHTDAALELPPAETSMRADDRTARARRAIATVARRSINRAIAAHGQNICDGAKRNSAALRTFRKRSTCGSDARDHQQHHHRFFQTGAQRRASQSDAACPPRAGYSSPRRSTRRTGNEYRAPAAYSGLRSRPTAAPATRISISAQLVIRSSTSTRKQLAARNRIDAAAFASRATRRTRLKSPAPLPVKHYEKQPARKHGQKVRRVIGVRRNKTARATARKVQNP